MKEFKLAINKHLTKWGVKNKIENLLEEYNEPYNPFVKVKLKNGKKVYGMVAGGTMRHGLHVFKLQGGTQTINLKNISTIQILNHYEVLQLFVNLPLFFNLKKEAKEINEKLNDSQQKVEEILNIKL